ncbi:hypothetical protein EBR43_13100 [bacterium]|nr:hypothetical protein [bacterium]
MKSLKDFIDESEEDSLQEDEQALLAKPMDPPPILIMRRKSIRQFGNGQRVAMYYVDKLNKYVTIPYGEMAWAAEELEITDGVIEENVMHHLKSIVDNHSAKSLKFKDGSSMKVDVQTANAIMKVHGALNNENKKKVSDMAHKSKSHFKKVADFAWKHTTYKAKD